ncbi:DUF3299 domain-containing protein [Poseidonocella sedimentorum]|uniref:DUF3299 domain-containing protein n=1 Tax=Poseidonocella sedimentorum TaxID=871652 RepID=A0A1I6ERL5_9RHOB|nr:DUF3299 domain-containing protein [Poseidonocella sedimentorum]SFR20122.1 hypothetical protein SAMN04515673_1197 [Poseidonocella sedimentorum]
MTQLRSSLLTRRSWLLGAAALAAGALRPGTARAASPLELSWDDLIPPGVPYAEIIAEGEMDVEADTWRPVYDANAVRVNRALDGRRVRMPGYVLPLDTRADGPRDFVLVPYVGACIHVPPPPPNQLVFVTTEAGWDGGALWDAVWVTGILRTQLQSTDVAETGYALQADKVELFEW